MIKQQSFRENGRQKRSVRRLIPEIRMMQKEFVFTLGSLAIYLLTVEKTRNFSAV